MTTLPALSGDSMARRIRHELGMRVLPFLVFFVLFLYDLEGMQGDVRRAIAHHTLVGSLPNLVAEALYLAFVCLNVVLFVARPPAIRRDNRLGAWAMAMLGTFGLVIGPALPGGPRLFDLGAAGADVRLALAISSMVLAIGTLCVLGGSFGLTPEARRLVSSGPYRMVRHPLYLCETVNFVGLALVSGHATVAALTVVVIGAQVCRARFEEALLSAAFPEYSEAMADVPHFLPGIY
ncbi:MAG: methyltransferase family protein [Acidimicrobiales bacterium]